MEEEKKVPPTSEPNPDEGDQVKESDLTDEAGKEEPKPTGEGSQEGEGKEGADETQAKPRQSRKTDAEYARERRERKAREEAERKAREEEIRRQAVFEVKSGQVTAEELRQLDIEKVEDDDQLFLVEQLRKAKAEGVENPEAAAYRALFKRQSAEKAQAKAKADADAEAERRQKEKVAEDQKAFKSKFGKTTGQVLAEEPEFKELFGALIDPDKGNFTALYEAYQKLKKDQSSAAKREGAFPTDANGDSKKPAGAEESDEDFRRRWKATHGHW